MAKQPKATVPGHLKSELATLSKDQLEAVARLTASMLGGQYVAKDKVAKAETGGQHARAEALYEALSVELYRKRRITSEPFQLALSKQSKAVRALLKKHAELDVFLDAACGKRKLTEAERLKLYSFTANIVASALVKAELAMSMTTLVNWLSNAPNLFDQQFPGYIKSGLLHTIVSASLQKPITGNKGSIVEVRREEKAEAGAGGKRPPAGARNIRDRYRNRRVS